MLEADQRRLLEEVIGRAQGDSQVTVDLWAVGRDLGLDRSRTETLSVQLMAVGFLQMKSLSGGVAITAAGMDEIGPLATASSEASAPPDLAGLCAELESELPSMGLAERLLKDALADVACIRTQLGKSRPGTKIVAACASSIADTLSGVRGASGLVEHLKQFLKE